MKEKLQVVAHWIPPTPSNLFKIGLFLEISPCTLWILDRKEDNFFVKIYEILMMGHSQHGDDFPAKLYKALDYIKILGLFFRNCHHHKLEDPFLLPHSPSFCMPERGHLPLEHYINMLCLELSCALVAEPGIEILAALHFNLSPKRFDSISYMDVKLYHIFTTAYRNCSDSDFLAKLKILVQDVGAFINFKQLVEKFETPPAEFEMLFL